jgi:hypothetical protein
MFVDFRVCSGDVKGIFEACSGGYLLRGCLCHLLMLSTDVIKLSDSLPEGQIGEGGEKGF